MQNPKKNFIYNLVYQILILIIPLITAPYLARVVGAEGVGTYSYIYSIVYYFMLLTLLGINNYGNRTIAKHRDNKKKMSKLFWSMYYFQLLMGLIMFSIYLLYIFIFDNTYKIIALIQSIFIISSMIDINWFYFGLEEFKITITRNIFIKLGNVILIFLLVKSKDDLWKYTLIMAGMTVLSQIILWAGIKKRIIYVKVNKNDILKHLKPNLTLFIPVVAVSLYKMMDKIMLGGMSNVVEVGYYENAEKIINIPMTLITALGTVMLPRMSNILAKGKHDKINEYISKSINFVMFMAFPMCLGLIAIGYKFAPIYFGIEFQKTGILIILLAITLPFLSFANVIRTQYLIPAEKDKVFIASVIFGAIVNLIMNIILIPKLYSIGACLATIVAEIAVMLYQSISVRREINISLYVKNITSFLIKGIIMFIIIYPINLFKINEILKIVIQILIGCIIYTSLNLKYILSISDLNKIFKKRNEKICQ